MGADGGSSPHQPAATDISRDGAARRRRTHRSRRTATREGDRNATGPAGHPRGQPQRNGPAGTKTPTGPEPHPVSSLRGVPLRRLRRVHIARQRLLRDLDERREGVRVVHGQLGEDLAVDLDVGGLQTLDEAVVRDAVGAGSGVDPLDPELTEVALALLAVVVVVDQGVGDLLLGLAVQTRALATVTTGLLEDRPALLVGVDCPLDACHLITPSRGPRCYSRDPKTNGIPTRDGAPRSGALPSLAEKLLDLLDVRLGHLDGAGQGTRLAGRLVLEQVALAGALAQHLAGARDLEALARSAVRLVLRHGAVVSSSLALPSAGRRTESVSSALPPGAGGLRGVLVSGVGLGLVRDLDLVVSLGVGGVLVSRCLTQADGLAGGLRLAGF